MQVEPEKIRVSCISKVGVAAVLVWNKATSSIVCGLPASRGKLVLVPARESIPLTIRCDSKPGKWESLVCSALAAPIASAGRAAKNRRQNNSLRGKTDRGCVL